MDTTILYYTSNREDESFEQKVRDNILRVKGDLPIISVSQKPIDFGENICVGEHEACYYNLLKQVRIGLDCIKTTFVINAEADFLHTPDFFSFEPKETGRFYRYNNIWVLFAFRKYRRYWYAFKNYSDGAQIVDVKTWKKYIDHALGNRTHWGTQEDGVRYPKNYYFSEEKSWTGSPSVTFKTGNGVRLGTSTMKNIRVQYKLLPWGYANDIVKEYMGES